MKFSRLAFILMCALTVFASDSPDTREITDPKTIASLPALRAAPIPVDDLFYTRSISGVPVAYGKEVVFTTNLTRSEQSLESERCRRLADPAKPVRRSPVRRGLVARREMDRL